MLDLLTRLVRVLRSELGGRVARPRGDDDGDGEARRRSGRGTDRAAGRTAGRTAELDAREREYYANLELAPGASWVEIKQAYRRLLHRYHPDRHASDPDRQATADAITKRLNEAMAYFENKFDDGGER